MGSRIPALFLALCLAAAVHAQTYTVARLSEALQNIAGETQHKYSDNDVAAFLSRVKLSDRLDDKTLEDLQSRLRLGAKSTAALRKLRDQSQSLPVAAAAPAAGATHPIPIPSAEEQGRILDDVRNYALNYSRNLPDFICLEVEERYGARPVTAGDPDWRKLDDLTKRLSYFEQKEDYKLLTHNNKLATNQDVKTAGGSQSFGDFGSMMRQVFEPVTEALFDWDHWGTLDGQRVMVFKYRVAQERSRYHIVYEGGRDIVTAYHGLVYVDPESHVVKRISVIAENIPADFPVKAASDILDYDYQDLSGQTFLLPSKAEIQMATSDGLTRNHKDFRTYRKYSADAVLKYDTEATAPVKK